MKNPAIILIGFTLSLNNSAYAQQKKDANSNENLKLTIDKKLSNQANPVLSLADSLLKSYIIEDKALKMWESLTLNFQNGNYKNFTDGKILANQINQELFKISNDLHLKLVYSESPLPPILERNSNSDGDETMLVEFLENNQYGIQKQAILKGNIGYLELSLFAPLKQAQEKLVDAMKYVEDTDALIIDLRKNTGSLDPDTVPFLMSYFFENPVHLFNFENREKNSVKQLWTLDQVPGKKYLNKPVSILTSPQTFSGGEEFAYDMKYHNKATIIGETTKGGANPTSPVRINDHFLVVMPKERSVNTITKTNWEQVGVKPDREVDANFALYEAHYLLLDELYCKNDFLNSSQIDNAINELVKNRPQYKKVTFKLNDYLDAKNVAVVGSFNYWNPVKHPLKKVDKGWIAEVDVLPGEIQYKFIVDGEWILDPKNPNTGQHNEHTNSVIKISN